MNKERRICRMRNIEIRVTEREREKEGIGERKDLRERKGERGQGVWLDNEKQGGKDR